MPGTKWWCLELVERRCLGRLPTTIVVEATEPTGVKGMSEDELVHNAAAKFGETLDNATPKEHYEIVIEDPCGPCQACR